MMKIEKPKVKRNNPEEKIQNKIRKILKADGWVTEKMHGNQYQSGIPDLYCFHRKHGHRWVEIKTEKGRLTHAQGVTFKAWEKAGLGVYILTHHSEINLLTDGSEPNWRRFAHRIRPPKTDYIGSKNARRRIKQQDKQVHERNLEPIKSRKKSGRRKSLSFKEITGKSDLN